MKLFPGIVFIALFVVGLPSNALSNELYKAIGLCQAEIQYYVLSSGKVSRMSFPNDFHLKDMPGAYFIEYRNDLKAGMHLRTGGIRALDIRCQVQKKTIELAYAKINGKYINTLGAVHKKMEHLTREIQYLQETSSRRTHDVGAAVTKSSIQSHTLVSRIAYIKDNKMFIPSGLLSNYVDIIGKKDIYVLRQNDTFAPWPNDIEKLCRDYMMYKNLLDGGGTREHLSRIKSELQSVQHWLTMYNAQDVATMMQYLSVLN